MWEDAREGITQFKPRSLTAMSFRKERRKSFSSRHLAWIGLFLLGSPATLSLRFYEALSLVRAPN
ncbi:hypothetical protein BDQ12DRAFT_238218 [Crucibulum laeve]|uniref:Uncharacterized protein n=1 Tax=Crucibulum laeve TaxID=68775 RepID=A0A5C3LUG1_9AGAR|nr:hypothetical protein BDQ12DRAFT_238218 [Crucibulum laeve]